MDEPAKECRARCLNCGWSKSGDPDAVTRGYMDHAAYEHRETGAVIDITLTVRHPGGPRRCHEGRQRGRDALGHAGPWSAGR